MQIQRIDLVRALKSKHFVEDASSGDHDFYSLVVDGKETAIWTMLSRAKNYRTLQAPILSKIARQMRLKNSHVVRFVECTISGDDYLTMLRAQNALP